MYAHVYKYIYHKLKQCSFICINYITLHYFRFVANFRVSKDIFVMILEKLQNKWVQGSRATYVRPDIKLATFLRFLATGGYQRSLGNESVSSTGKATVYRIINECLKLFASFICPEWIKMPAPNEEQEVIQKFFERFGFPGVLGCVDGTHIRIKTPGDEVKHLYFNRKGYCSLNAMMVNIWVV